MPVIARINGKEVGFVKKPNVPIAKIAIKDAPRSIGIPTNELQRLFFIAYGIMVHKPQLETYHNEYTNDEFGQFDDILNSFVSSLIT